MDSVWQCVLIWCQHLPLRSRFGLRDDIKDARMDAANDIEVILKGCAPQCHPWVRNSNITFSPLTICLIGIWRHDAKGTFKGARL